MNLDDIISDFVSEINEKEKKKLLSSQEDREIAAKKRKILLPIEKFLQKFVDLELLVNHRDQYSKNTNKFTEPQKFSFEEVDSSKKWAPGISLLINHPAEIEIAIPNRIEEEGVVVIKVTSHHPYSFVLENKFNSIEDACKGLAKFLSYSSISINKDLKQNKSKDTSFFNNAPSELPSINTKKADDILNDD